MGQLDDRLRHLGLLLLVVVALPTQAAERQSTSVLTPQTGDLLEAAFAHLPDGVTLADGKIQARRVDIQVCRPGGPCANLTLGPPQPPCSGDATPAFCVQFVGPTPPFRETVLRALRTVPLRVWQGTVDHVEISPWPARRVWLQLGLWGALLVGLLLMAHGRRTALLAAGGVLAAAVTWQSAMQKDARAWPARDEFEGLGVEAAWWLVPIVVGHGAAWLARRWPMWRTLAMSSPALLALVPLVWPALRMGDALPMAALACLVALWQSDARPQRRARWGLSLGLLIVGLCAVEAVLRVATPEPPAVEEARRWILEPPTQLANAGTRGAWAEALFADPQRFQILRAKEPHGPWLLHIGDSMLYGVDLTAAEAVPSQLQRLVPALEHVNAGVPSTTVDVQFVILQRLLRAWPAPVAVVLHTYAGNDLTGLDDAAAFCGGAPVLAPHPAPVAVQCTAPKTEPLAHRLINTPLPLPLARAASWSWLARRLAVAHQVARALAEPTDLAAATARYTEIAGALHHELARRHIALLVAAAPTHKGKNGDTEAVAAALQNVFVQLHVPVFDAQRVFDREVARGAGDRLFQSQADPHFSAVGAALYAAELAPWLVQQLRTAGFNPP